jgi:hypothetical protein
MAVAWSSLQHGPDAVCGGLLEFIENGIVGRIDRQESARKQRKHWQFQPHTIAGRGCVFAVQLDEKAVRD